MAASSTRPAAQARVQRGIGFRDRKFDEHHPAERRDRRGSGQYLLALDVLRTLQRIRPGVGAAGLRSLHLRQLRHVGVAQHQADVGMRDQPALRADHIGVAALADLDLRHHVPDQLEVDLGDADAGIAPGAGERQASCRARTSRRK